MPQPGIGTPELAPSSADNCVIWCVPSLPWGSVSSALSQEQGQVAAQAPSKHGVLELWPVGEAAGGCRLQDWGSELQRNPMCLSGLTEQS